MYGEHTALRELRARARLAPRLLARRAVLAAVLWTAGVSLAVEGQHVLAARIELGRALLLLGALVAVPGMWLVDRRKAQQTGHGHEAARVSWRSRRVVAAALALLLGLIGSFVTAELVARAAPVAAAAAVWVTSLGFVVGGGALGIRSPYRARLRRPMRPGLIRTGAVTGLLALALALRLPHLASIPPDVHGDEAAVGLDARALLHGGWGGLFGLGWSGVPQLSYAFVALAMRLFGDDLYGLRMASVFLGVLSIWLLYLVARRLFGTVTALAAAFVLAVAQWHIQFSRTGFHYMQAVPALLLVVLFMLRALDGGRELDFVLAGIALGGCLVVYYAGREAYVIVAAYLLYRLLRDRGFLRRNAVGFACAAIGLWVFLAPVLVSVDRAHQSLLGDRTNAVWLFTPDNLEHERQVYGVTSTLDIVAIQARRTLEAFNRTGETSVQYGRAGLPLFDTWSAALLVIGAGYVLSRSYRPKFLLLLVWLAVPLTICVLTVDAPFSPHMIVALPVLAMLPALVLDAGGRVASALHRRLGPIVFGLLAATFGVLTLYANDRDFFHQQVTKIRVAGAATLMSNYIVRVNDRYRIYVVSDLQLSLRDYTVALLAPHVDGADLGLHPHLPMTWLPGRKGAAFVFDPTSEGAAALRDLTRFYPSGRRSVHRDVKGDAEFVTYTVPRRELLRAASEKKASSGSRRARAAPPESLSARPAPRSRAARSGAIRVPRGTASARRAAAA